MVNIPQRDWTVKQLIEFLRTDESKHYLSVKARTVLLNTLVKLVGADALNEMRNFDREDVWRTVIMTLENRYEKSIYWKEETAEACNWFYAIWGDGMGCSPLEGKD